MVVPLYEDNYIQMANGALSGAHPSVHAYVQAIFLFIECLKGFKYIPYLVYLYTISKHRSSSILVTVHIK